MRPVAPALVLVALALAGPAARAQAPDQAQAALIEGLLETPAAELDERLAAQAEVLSPALVESLLAVAGAAQKANQLDRALACARVAERVAARLARPELRARALYLTANTLRRRSEFGAAQQAAEASLAAAREGGDRKREASALGLLGIMARQQGQYELAQERLEAALVIDEAENSGPNLANRLASLGLLHSQLGDYAAALARFERSLEVRRQLGEEANQGSAYNGIGHVHLDLGRLDLARAAFARALALSEARSDSSAAAANLFNLALIDLAEQRLDAGLGTMTRSLEAARQAQDREGQASALDGLGVIERARGNDGPALAHFEAALALSQEIGVRATELDARTERSKALLALGRAPEALAEARSAEALGAEVAVPDQVWPLRLALGRALEANGDLAGARASYEQAIAQVEDLRSGVLGGDEAQPDFLAPRLEPYERLLDLDLRTGNQVGALNTAERARARTLVDTLVYGRQLASPAMTGAERAEEQRIERRLGALVRRAAALPAEAADAQVMGGGGSPPEALSAARRELAEFRARLYARHPELRLARGSVPAVTLADAAPLLPDSGSVALVYAASDERTVLFVLERDVQRQPPVRLTTYRLPLAGRALGDQVRALRSAIAGRDLLASAAARQLYQALVAPAAKHLRGRRLLVVVPDGPLWELPFAALEDGAGRALIERAALLLVPSLTALRELSQRPPAAAGADRLALLAYANPASAGQPALPEAERQVARLTALVGPAQALVRSGAQAREAAFKSEAPRARLIHLATHGVLDGDSPLFSHLALSTEPPGADQDGRLEARELLELPLDADLVVLSACETALGRVRGGEGMVGLAWATLLAGARSLVVSQWRVEARATARLMDAFYERLLQPPAAGRRRDAAEALRAAMLQVRHDPRTRHPFYWAAFSALGSGSF